MCVIIKYIKLLKRILFSSQFLVQYMRNSKYTVYVYVYIYITIYIYIYYDISNGLNGLRMKKVMLEMAIGTKSKKTKTASRSCWVRKKSKRGDPTKSCGEIHGETDQNGSQSHSVTGFADFLPEFMAKNRGVHQTKSDKPGPPLGDR